MNIHNQFICQFSGYDEDESNYDKAYATENNSNKHRNANPGIVSHNEENTNGSSIQNPYYGVESETDKGNDGITEDVNVDFVNVKVTENYYYE